MVTIWQRLLTQIAATALVVAALDVPAGSSAETGPIVGTVQSPDAIAACSLSVDPATNSVTPLVTLQAPARADATAVRFALYDAAGTLLGTHDVSVPPPSYGPFLAPFSFAGAIASLRCAVAPPTPPTAAAAAADATHATGGGQGGGGGGALIIGGVVAVGALVAVAAGSSHGGGSPSTAPPQPPTSLPTATARPTPVRTATPVATPGATLRPTPMPTPTSPPTPTATPLPTATPSPQPTATPVPGSLVLMPSSLSFTALGSTNAQSSTASESNYAGSFASSGTSCTNIATISGPSSGNAFTVTPVGAGTCSYTIASTNRTATLSITVTVTNGVIEGRRRQGSGSIRSR